MSIAVCGCPLDLVAEGADGVCWRCGLVVPFDGYAPGGLGCLVVLALGLIFWLGCFVAMWVWWV